MLLLYIFHYIKDQFIVKSSKFDLPSNILGKYIENRHNPEYFNEKTTLLY